MFLLCVHVRITVKPNAVIFFSRFVVSNFLSLCCGEFHQSGLSSFFVFLFFLHHIRRPQHTRISASEGQIDQCVICITMKGKTSLMDSASKRKHAQ